MVPASNRPVSFSDVAFKGRFGLALVMVLVLLVVEIIAYGVIQGTAPTSYSGTAEMSGTDIDIDVPDTSEQPIRFYVSHTYQLRRINSRYFDVADGEADAIAYNVSIRDGDGAAVFNRDSGLSAPLEHEFAQYASTATELVEDNFDVYLSPGSYNVQIETDHPIEYGVEQVFKYEAAANVLLALWFVAIVLLVVLVFLAVNKQNRLNKTAMVLGLSTAPSAPLYPSPYVAPAQGAIAVPAMPVQPPIPQYGTSAVQYPAFGAPAVMYPGGYQYAPPYQPPIPRQDPATVSNLQPAPGGLYAEVVCTACGRTVRNPPIYGVVTCEHCGEQGRLY